MTHQAAILPSKGAAFSIEPRVTPTPGPNDLLILVKNIALNPVDHAQRAFGFFVEHYPAVLGSDIAGTVISAGSSAPSAFKPGTRVAAFAPAFYTRGMPDYGAFQDKTLVPAANAVILPEHVSFAEGALLPMAVLTTWSGLYSIGLPRDDVLAAAGGKGMIVWGGSSSVGSTVVQTAKILGFTVYAAASEKQHAYVQQLGADRTFEYKQPDVVDQIVKAAKNDGVAINIGYDAVGQWKYSMEVVRQAKSVAQGRVVSAPPLDDDVPKMEDVDVKFVLAPEPADVQAGHFSFVFNEWLQENLASKKLVPSPKVRIYPGGLPKIMDGLAELKAGVSGEKLVLEV
ncbi:MAG: hypothetical protein M1828_001547 [Chrysothrix sp. TS-e1954]|nr:MAG: hypothetical protein M1828_001547 [Chrysothrix sp. TS-e1954]